MNPIPLRGDSVECILVVNGGFGSDESDPYGWAGSIHRSAVIVEGFGMDALEVLLVGAVGFLS